MGRMFLRKFFSWGWGVGERNKGKEKEGREEEEKLSLFLPDSGCHFVRMSCLELLNSLIWSGDGRRIKRKEPKSLMTL